MQEYKKALVLLNMGGPRNKEELEMFLRNMFNDKNILTMKSDLLRSMIASLIVFSRKILLGRIMLLLVGNHLLMN